MLGRQPAEEESLVVPSEGTAPLQTHRKRLFYGIGFAGVTVCVVLVALAVTLAIVLTDDGGSETIEYDNFEDHAKAILSTTPLIDGHNDLPNRIMTLWRDNMTAFDLREYQPNLMTDIPRLRMGMMGGQFWSVYVPCETGAPPVQKTMNQIDVVYQLAELYPDVFQIATTSQEVLQAFHQGKVASLMGMEGGHSINNSIATLRMFHSLGARYMTLTHTCTLPWVDSANGPFLSNGLSAFGIAVVGEMNRMGMIVDISHVSVPAMKMTLAHSVAPVIFSHSGVYTLCPSIRNVPDDVLDELKVNGGVIMIPFYPVFLTCSNNATVTDIMNHIHYVADRIGVDYVGLGADLDGISVTVPGADDVSKYLPVTARLLEEGFSEADVRKIIGENILRVLTQVEQVAAVLQRTTLPSQAVCC